MHRCKSTQFCKVYGHEKGRQEGTDFYEDSRTLFMGPRMGYQIRKYYAGILWYCQIPGCEWKHFDGHVTRVTKIMQGVEYDIETDGSGDGKGVDRNAGPAAGTDQGI